MHPKTCERNGARYEQNQDIVATKTWNPTFGCSKISPGCARCYAERTALRFGHSPLRRKVLRQCAECGRQTSVTAGTILGLNTYETAWTWLHKIRRAMVRPRRDLLAGRMEVDESYLGGLEEGPLFRAKPRKRRNLRLRKSTKP